MQPEAGDNDRKMQNSQFSERVSQVGLRSGYIMLQYFFLCMPVKILSFFEYKVFDKQGILSLGSEFAFNWLLS